MSATLKTACMLPGDGEEEVSECIFMRYEFWRHKIAAKNSQQQTLETSMTNLAQIFTGLLLYAYVGIHQMRQLIFDNYQRWTFPLETVDTLGNFQRLAFTVRVSQHRHKTTKLWKFVLNWSSKLRDINVRKNTLGAPWKLLLSRKLRHWGSCLSQCFILSTSHHYS